MPVKRVSRVGWALVVTLLVVAAGLSPVAVVAADGVEVGAVDHAGAGVVATENGRTYVASWQPSTVSVAVASDSDDYEVCLQTDLDDGSTMLLACEPLGSAGANASDERRVEFAFTTWPVNATGDRTLTAVVRPGGGGEPVAQASHGVTVLAPAGDADGDGLGNRDELDRGTDVLVADTDTDGVPDGEEVNRYETDPTNTDTDGDELSDGVEVNEQGSNPTETDTDSDGLDDGAEVTTHGTDPTTADTDGDGLDDGAEVNDYETNPTEADTDGDGLEDGPEVNVHETDPTAADTDGDGLEDGPEVNRYETNPTAADTDGDGLDDGREVNVLGTDPNRGDTDGDGRGDGAEVEAGSDPNAAPGSVVGSLGLGGDGWLLVLAVAAVAVVLVAVGARVRGSEVRALLSDVRSRATDRTAGRRDGAAADTVQTGGSDGPVRPEPTADAYPGPEELLDDETRILKLLDDNGGQLRQSKVVEGTGWSKSKVSRVLSRMADEGSVAKINLGRENLIARPENVPEHARSPFDES
ncbi:MarR family transcriptional regulator [Haloferax sp. Atlit-4N]|uniref:helix-turn-helix transcriptional regulator n=1 Tax=Haloferax sp. Atlit-4N TaxID=2077206 RepID=UPI000E25B9E3|nr:helix-turn-helix domain-containing protein [Haloferax sp. Atlit-4N]RDZ51168.1 MarR family transcriptional regulator [Haloferax sp. Atlit-4N]